ncbi:helix-turn-helix domain-containing protein [Paenibacillus doosanensis]|uniref:helix-turn-helix domain-containing protein n=1 Tax=Paenibacillus doosanensis TaxID=1229154 RepID=UPI00217F3A7A|nr:helix-turn-helix domain-containing protein [Paenibacillus doosanensis]MCS7462065.1 helix-turn-helix domain-containing protein [Paenibacillus doosanensis]
MLRRNGANRTRARHRLFARLLIPYLVFLMLAIMIGLIIYQKTIVLIEKEATASHMNLLEQSKDILDRRLEELASIAQQLAADTRIMQFQSVTDPYKGTNTFRIMDTNKSLYDYKLSNNFVFNYYVLFKNSEMVFTPGASYSFEHFFNRVANYKGMNYTSWYALMSSDFHMRKVLPAQEISMEGVPYSMLTYIQSLGYPGNPQGAIAIMVDQREIQKLFQGLDISSGGWAYIVDKEGQIISALSPGDANTLPIELGRLVGDRGVVEQRIDAKPMMVTYTKSSYNGWTYVVGQPTAIALGKVRYIQKIIVTFACVFLLAGVLAAYVLAYRNSKPLRALINTIMEKTDVLPQQRDAFGIIGETVNGLFQNNDKLKAEIKQQVPLLRAAYFQRLLNGQFVSSRDFDALLKHVGLDLVGMSYRVAIVRLRGFDKGYSDDLLEELDRSRVLAKELLRRTMDEDGFVCEIGEDQFAVLFTYKLDEREPYKAYVEARLKEARDEIGLQLKLQSVYGVGGACDSLTGISRSYEQAREALNAQLWSNQEGGLWFDELPADMANYYLPQDVETRLIHLAKAGDQTEVQRTLDELYRENFELRQLPIAVMKLFIFEMWGCLVKLLPQMDLDQQTAYNRMSALSGANESYESMSKSYQAIRDTFQWVCESANEHKKSQNVELIDSIIGLLQSSYMDSELCLDVVADRIRISKVYLSQFFKEQTGVNFSDYLESLRMDEAKALLQTTSLTVNDISDRVGYSSSNTFCRAFKRLHGVSPTAFRKLVLKKLPG